MKKHLLLSSALLLALSLSTVARAVPAPDPTEYGPYATATGSYQFPAEVMADVLSDRMTELWAEVYYPEDAPAPMPLIVILHGNHATCGFGSNPRQDTNCQYTNTGTCPAGYVVVPNHLGYEYMAERLASWGYYVVSINANRGITCGSGVSGDSGLNLARGRLILKHLEQLSLWTTGQDTPPGTVGMDLLGALDFGNVGLAGHSRGGEGVRAAYAQYLDGGSPWPGAIQEPVEFTAIFEIGAVDGQTSRILDAKGVPWNQVLPMCDGDVYDLQGIKPYDRMMDDLDELAVAPKSTYAVWGANHNFFNTEWQTSDSPGCVGHEPLFPSTIGSPEQRTVGLTAAMAFFRTYMDGVLDTGLVDNFDPLSELPALVSDITRVERNFSLSPNGETSPQLEDFSGPTGRNMYGYRNFARNVTVSHGTVPGHYSSVKGGKMTWERAGRGTLFQTTWAAFGDGLDFTGHDTLEIQVSRSSSSLNPDPQVPTDFSLNLIDSSRGKSATLQLSDYDTLLGPVGSPYRQHQLFHTVRIPLADFTGIDMSSVRSLRLTFDRTNQGEIYVGGIRVSRFTETMVPAAVRPAAGLVLAEAAAEPVILDAPGGVVQKRGSLVGVQQVAAAPALNGAAAVEIELALDGDTFPVRDALAVLEIGAQRFTLSRHPGGDTSRIVFTIPAGDAANFAKGDAIRVYYGSPENGASNWEAGFGSFR